MRSKIQLFNIDCMEFMRDKPDNYYQLAIVDPPYFHDVAKETFPGAKITKCGTKSNCNLTFNECNQKKV